MSCRFYFKPALYFAMVLLCATGAFHFLVQPSWRMFFSPDWKRIPMHRTLPAPEQKYAVRYVFTSNGETLSYYEPWYIGVFFQNKRATNTYLTRVYYDRANPHRAFSETAFFAHGLLGYLLLLIARDFLDRFVRSVPILGRYFKSNAAS